MAVEGFGAAKLQKVVGNLTRYCFALTLAACSLGRPATELPTSAPVPIPTLANMTPVVSQVMTPDAAIIIASPLPSAPLPLPSPLPSPTPTLGPIEHRITAGDTLGYLITRYGYKPLDRDAIEQVIELNQNVPDADTLPGVGTVILVPRPTATPFPIGFEMTATADAELGTVTRGGITLAAAAELICHEVRGGETFIEIALKYGLTVEIIAKLNPTINTIGCDFAQPGGGSDCNPLISIGQCVTVPGPTPIPTHTPTPSGLETATPTPTPPPPQMLAPVDGALLPAEPTPILYWLSARPLQPGETYMVILHDPVTSEEELHVTRANALSLPQDWAAAVGDLREIYWRVNVVRRTEEGTYAFVSDFPPIRTFFWEGPSAEIRAPAARE